MIRLDKAVAKQANCSRERAKKLIEANAVLVDGNPCVKASEQIDEANVITVNTQAIKYVSRGGFKLEKAIERFDIMLNDMVCIDIGASTGGFTDCMLKHGAKKVYAIDVGREQLDGELAKDSRVINMEKTDIRSVTAEVLGEKADFIGTDVAFISLTAALENVASLMKPGAKGVCLVKPQFEVGRERIGKNGIVKELKAHLFALKKVYDFLNEKGLAVVNADFSPIKGGDGNIEFIFCFVNDKAAKSIEFSAVEKAAENAHESLRKG